MGKKILIATRSPEGLPGGSGFHLRNMIEVLERNGHSLSVFHKIFGEYDEPCEMIPFSSPIEPDVVIADYSWMCGAFDYLSDRILKICFVHDLRCRIIPCLEAIGYKDTQGWTEEKEAELLRKADILLVLNEEDATFCRRMAPDCKIVRIGIAMEPVEHDPAKEIPGRCIYVGSDNMENRYAWKWFSERVWPLVIKEIPTASYDAIISGFKSTQESLGEFYAQAQLAVVPHIMHGGLKIKTAEAFAHGLPVVGNVCAFDGFETIRPLDNADDPKQMAKSISELIGLLGAKSIARRVCEREMTPQAAYGELLKVLG